MRNLFIIGLIFFCSPALRAQVVMIGNTRNICSPDSNIVHLDSLPARLDSIDVIFLFSGAESSISADDADRLIQFVESGGGLYCGADNWPLQAESNQITTKVYQKELYGNYDRDQAEINTAVGNLSLDSLPYLPAGQTTVAFPLDYRLRVEAWIDDQALILSGDIGEGKLIIDGGYSRFYCDSRNDVTDQLLRCFIAFLEGKETKHVEEK